MDDLKLSTVIRCNHFSNKNWWKREKNITERFQKLALRNIRCEFTQKRSVDSLVLSNT